jgi:hypothetical protein
VSVDHLYYLWWLDEERRPWVRHECSTDGRVDEWRLPPPWHLDPLPAESGGGGIIPSLECVRCGAHCILGAADRIDCPKVVA